jgi:eukaryotic-like serine/threonine-protein kinase
MSDEQARFAQVQELFIQAVTVPEDERREYLSTLCRGNEDFLPELLELLEADSRGVTVLDDGLSQTACELFETPMSLPFRTIGPYTLLQLIGEGGMGAVFLARRADLANLVAIKLLRDAWLSPQRRERFLSEQRLLASLVHPSIARLYDAGVLDDGTPWFAMEFVEGETPDAYCNEARKTLRERLIVFRGICEAVQFAHEHAVIHRDLKPSNVLVKADGSVRLLDFGIAKQLSDVSGSEATQTVVRMLTPAYSAPEQLSGDPVGVYTDVYALGVILDELLTGSSPDRPHQGRDKGRTRQDGDKREKPSVRAAKQTTPVCQISKAEWEDLDVLCMTAAHPNPQRRYRSVEALIRDLDHFLLDQPLEARPESLSYQLGKFLRRKRAALSIAAAILLCFACLIGYFTYRLARSRDRAVAAANREQRTRRFMLQLLDGGEKTAGPAVDLKVTTVLERGEEEAKALDDEPAIQADLYETLGAMYQKLGKFDRANVTLKRALQERIDALGPESAETAESYVRLGLLQVDEAHFAEADSMIRKGYELAKGVRPQRDDVVADAAAGLGRVKEAQGDYKSAIPWSEQALALHPKQGTATNEFAAEKKELADTYFYAGQFDTSVRLTQEAMALHTKLHGPRHPLVADDLVNLGAVQIEKGHYPEAETLYRRALEINESWYGKAHPETAGNLYMLGEALTLERRFPEAEKELRQALAIRERVYGTNHPRTANVLNELCIIDSMTRKVKEARACYQQVIDIYKAVYHDKHYLIGLAVANLATVNMKDGNYPQAEILFREALRRYADTLPPDHLYVGVVQFKLGHTLLLAGRTLEAKELLTLSCRILEKQGNASLEWLQEAREDLASLQK